MKSEKTFSQMLEETGYVVYTTRGVSMQPLLRQGKDVVVIEKPKEHWKKYDTVLFLRKNGKYILHRILKIYDDKYWIVGDNCFKGEIVNGNQIIGVMTSIKRGNKIIQITNWQYRLYIHLWCDFYPVRFLLLRAYKNAYRVWTFVKRRIYN